MNKYPHIKTKQNYSQYEKAVQDFFETEEINGFSLAITEEQESQDCNHCGNTESFEPSFSWRACECCSRSLGGDRYHVVAWKAGKGGVFCLDVCIDCYYYEAYGQLDDMTMMDMEE